MGHLSQIVVDCAMPSSLARFWAAALDGFEVLPYDDAEVARLAALGFTPETDPWVIVEGPDVELCFQKVDLERGSKTPMHFDIAAADVEAEVQRLIGLGATVERSFDDHTWMRDPEGNDFCVVYSVTRSERCSPRRS